MIATVTDNASVYMVQLVLEIGENALPTFPGRMQRVAVFEMATASKRGGRGITRLWRTIVVTTRRLTQSVP